MQARDKCLAISPLAGDGKSPAVRRFVHWVGHSLDMQARDKCLAISPKVGDGKSPAVRRFVHWVGHSHWMQHWPRADGLGWPRANDGRWPNASWARIQWMSGLSWIAVTSNEVYGLLWSKWPVDHPWSWMTNVRAFTSVPASRETRHRSVSPQDLWDQEEAKGTWSFEIIKKCFSTSGEVRGLEWPSVGDLTPLPASRGTRHFFWA